MCLTLAPTFLISRIKCFPSSQVEFQPLWKDALLAKGIQIEVQPEKLSLGGIAGQTLNQLNQKRNTPGRNRQIGRSATESVTPRQLPKEQMCAGLKSIRVQRTAISHVKYTQYMIQRYSGRLYFLHLGEEERRADRVYRCAIKAREPQGSQDLQVSFNHN